MKFLCPCILLTSVFAVLNGASIQQLEEQANGEQTAKRELLVKKLRELLKSTAAWVNDEERSNAGKNNQGVASKQADAGIVKSGGLSARRQKMVRRLKSTRGRQLSASARKQISHPNEDMIQALRKRISGVTSGKQKTTARKQLIRQNILNRKFGSTVQRQKAHGPSLATAKRTHKTPKKAQRSPNKRLTSQKKRQNQDYASAHMTCECCNHLLPDYYQYQGNYEDNYRNYYQSTPGYSSYNYEDTPTSPTPYYHYPDIPDTDEYPQDEWSKCFETNCSYSRTCDVPCLYEYGGDFYWCVIAEAYFLDQELEDVYMSMNMDMCYSAELECLRGNLMEELACRISRDMTDPYMSGPCTLDYMMPDHNMDGQDSMNWKKK